MILDNDAIENSKKGDNGEEKVSLVLHTKDNDNNHRYIGNYMYKDDYGNTHQIDHIEIRKNGIFCIETKNYSGVIFGNENSEKWIQYLNNKKNYFLNPIKQNKSHVKCLERLLDNKYKINSIIVFVQNNADKIKIDNVINLNILSNYISKFDNSTNLTDEEIQNIMNTLLLKMSNVKLKEHINNIESNSRLVANNICPRCKMGTIILKTGSYGLFYGCTNYPKCKFTKKANIKIN